MSANSAATPVVLDELVLVTTRLADLMARENEILRSMRPGDIRDLQADKAELAQRYEHMMLATWPSLTAISNGSRYSSCSVRSSTCTEILFRLASCSFST